MMQYALMRRAGRVDVYDVILTTGEEWPTVGVYDVDKQGIGGVQSHHGVGVLKVGLGRVQAGNPAQSHAVLVGLVGLVEELAHIATEVSAQTVTYHVHTLCGSAVLLLWHRG